MRKVVYITGTRADYGVMRTVLKAIDINPNLQLSLIVMGMHLMPEFGHTIEEVKRDNYKIEAQIEMNPIGGDKGSMVRSLGKATIDISQVLEKVQPDFILIEGDRGEGLAGAIAGAYLQIPVAHVSGGDITEGGMIDDSIRHAITKFAHVHFPGTTESAKRIECLGEEPDRIHMVGTPGILSPNNIKSEDVNMVIKKLNIDMDRPIIVVIQHPVTYESNLAPNQMEETMEALVGLKEQTILIYPNSDAGGGAMIDVIKNYEKYDFIKTFKNIPYTNFISLLSIASVMIGNSSAGIIRAPSLGLPFINTGTRQKGREHSNNVINVGYDRCEIISAVKRVLNDKKIKQRLLSFESPYHDLNTGELIADILSKMDTPKELLIKKFHYCR